MTTNDNNPGEFVIIPAKDLKAMMKETLTEILNNHSIAPVASPQAMGQADFMTMRDILKELDISPPMFYSKYRDQLRPFGLHQRDGFKSGWRIKRSNFELYQQMKAGILSEDKALNAVK